MLRLPDGMREEIKRLADEDGRSMNAQIVTLLNFALANSGIDIDELFRMLFALRKEVAGDASNARAIADHWQQLYTEKIRGEASYAGLAKAICEQIAGYGDRVPAELARSADNILSALNLALPEVMADLEAASKSMAKQPDTSNDD